MEIKGMFDYKYDMNYEQDYSRGGKETKGYLYVWMRSPYNTFSYHQIIYEGKYENCIKILYHIIIRSII